MKIFKTVKEGVKRALKINVSEQTPDPEVKDELAKAIKNAVRAGLFVLLVWLFPEQAQSIYDIAIKFLGL